MRSAAVPCTSRCIWHRLAICRRRSGTGSPPVGVGPVCQSIDPWLEIACRPVPGFCPGVYLSFCPFEDCVCIHASGEEDSAVGLLQLDHFWCCPGVFGVVWISGAVRSIFGVIRSSRVVRTLLVFFWRSDIVRKNFQRHPEVRCRPKIFLSRPVVSVPRLPCGVMTFIFVV